MLTDKANLRLVLDQYKFRVRLLIEIESHLIFKSLKYDRIGRRFFRNHIRQLNNRMKHLKPFGYV